MLARGSNAVDLSSDTAELSAKDVCEMLMAEGRTGKATSLMDWAEDESCRIADVMDMVTLVDVGEVPVRRVCREGEGVTGEQEGLWALVCALTRRQTRAAVQGKRVTKGKVVVQNPAVGVAPNSPTQLPKQTSGVSIIGGSGLGRTVICVATVNLLTV